MEKQSTRRNLFMNLARRGAQFPQSTLKQLCSRKTDYEQSREKASKLMSSQESMHLFSISDLMVLLSFTSSFEVYENFDYSILYQTINKYLRKAKISEQTIGSIQKNWKWKYAVALGSILLRLPSSPQMTLYRGINHRYTEEKGETITLCEFVSTSKSKDVALNFIRNQKEGCLLQIRCNKAYDIAKYSFYGSEGEHLILPFTQFLIYERTYEDSLEIVQLIQ